MSTHRNLTTAMLAVALLPWTSQARAQDLPASPEPAADPQVQGAQDPDTTSPAEATPETDTATATTDVNPEVSAAAPSPPSQEVASEASETSEASEVAADIAGDTAPSDGALEAFLAESQIQEATSSGPSLRIYGFADFSVAHEFGKKTSAAASTGPGTNFYIGNLNTYLDADLTHGFRSLSEIRFTYLPNGSAAGSGTSVSRFSATSLDYADSIRTLTWGAIEIERAWIEYQAHNLFTIRAGQFLTPYGIWNVDHGTPTIIPTARPYVVGDALFPERQTGFQVYGSYTQGIATLGYHVTLSNGRGNVSQYTDLDTNKAVGGRLHLALDGDFGQLSIGASGYVGRRTDTDVALSGTELVPDIIVQGDELSYAGDLLYLFKGLHVQFEGVGSEIQFTDKGRFAPVYGAPANARLADYRRWGLYGLIGYRTPWLGLMPYAMVSVFRPGAPAPVDVGPSYFDSVEYVAGLNMRPIAAVAIKLQYGALMSDPKVNLSFLDTPKVRHILTGQIAWSF